MENKKLTLEELEVQSFVTTVNNQDANVKGGATAGTCAPCTCTGSATCTACSTSDHYCSSVWCQPVP